MLNSVIIARPWQVNLGHCGSKLHGKVVELAFENARSSRANLVLHVGPLKSAPRLIQQGPFFLFPKLVRHVFDVVHRPG